MLLVSTVMVAWFHGHAGMQPVASWQQQVQNPNDVKATVQPVNESRN